TTKDVGRNAITIAPAALTRRASIERPHELTAIFLDPLVFREIAHSEAGFQYPEIAPQFGIVDPLIRSLGMTLDGEMRSNDPKPSFYADRPAATMASHIFGAYAGPGERELRGRGAHWTKLRRSIEPLHANIDKPLSLEFRANASEVSASPRTS